MSKQQEKTTEPEPELKQPAPTEELTEQPAAEKPVAEQPAAEKPVAEQPEKVTLRVDLPVEANENLKALAALWGETKTETARKLLTGQIQHHYSVNKVRGRL